MKIQPLNEKGGAGLGVAHNGEIEEIGDVGLDFVGIRVDIIRQLGLYW
jgi:hypothetical protein